MLCSSCAILRYAEQLAHLMQRTDTFVGQLFAQVLESDPVACLVEFGKFHNSCMHRSNPLPMVGALKGLDQVPNLSNLAR